MSSLTIYLRSSQYYDVSKVMASNIDLEVFQYTETMCVICRRSNIVCWQDMASFIVNDKWFADQKNTVEDDSVRIVIAVAKF
jgi:hypothetical protein